MITSEEAKSTISVSAEAVKAVRIEVLKKYGRMRGHLSEEASKALWAHAAILHQENEKKAAEAPPTHDS